MRRLLVLLGLTVAMTAVAASVAQAETPKKLDVLLYADTVNGSRPQGAKPRPIGCTQTDIFKRGEQLVFRVWGTEAATGDVLSTENVVYAYAKIAGQPNLKLTWGPHGAASNRVWFWAAGWNIPADYPLGTTTLRIVFKTESGKFGRYDHTVTINP